MAEFCHDYEPGGLGCPQHGCPPDCIGDFTKTARQWATKLEDGKEVFLGLCEGHGAALYLYREHANLYVEHSGRLHNSVAEWFPVEEFYSNPDLDPISNLVIVDFEVINSELIEYFAKHPERLRELEWRKFEELLDAIFRNLGYVTELGPGRGDQGIDLRLIRRDPIGDLVTLVQAKRYSSDRPIELEAVAALYGVVENKGANRGLFVTTSRYLPSARQFAGQQSQRLVLADSQDVAHWCRKVRPQTKLP
jgi:hypothetical protein